MKKLLALGNAYAGKSDWKDFALVKFCLFSLGLLAGLHLPVKHKKAFTVSALLIFAATYIPLMTKLIKIAAGKDEQAEPQT